jgi:hypothetical protein
MGEGQQVNALFVCFNTGYADYAKGAIQTFLRYHPGWRIHCHAVNCGFILRRDPFWQNTALDISEHEESFDDHGKEREYCNAWRFVALNRVLPQYEKVIATDVDILFKEPLTEIIDALDHHDLCMYYNPDGHDARNRAGASFIGVRSGRGANEFFSVYKKHLLGGGRNWWNDQICLARAAEEVGGRLSIYPIAYEDYCYSGLSIEGIEKCHVIQPRGDKNSSVLRYYRNLLDAELKGVTQKILIIGSGPTALKAQQWNLKGWHVIAINHAWKVVPCWNELIYPDDYTDEMPTNLLPGQTLISNALYMPANTAFGIQEQRGNSMIFQALYWALLKKPLIIGTVGADLYYPSTGNTHFYGTGTPDPLRLGGVVLKEKMERFMRYAQKQGVEVYNYSGEARGYNILPQRVFQAVSLSRRWPKFFAKPKKPHLAARRPRLLVQ